MKFRIEAYLYTEAGSIGEKFATMYSDSVEDAKNKFEEYNKQYNLNEDGTKAGKKYKVRVYVQGYKELADVNSFFAQFEA